MSEPPAYGERIAREFIEAARRVKAARNSDEAALALGPHTSIVVKGSDGRERIVDVILSIRFGKANSN